MLEQGLHAPDRRLGVVTVAVFDIDGVVADVRHRLHYLDRRPKDWGKFFNHADSDPALPVGIELVRLLSADHDIVWLTGRPEWLRRVTHRWLESHGLPTKELLMRGNGDYRPARILKVDVLRKLDARSIAAFVDDDPDVIASALNAGFPAQLADWVPHSKTLAEAQEKLGRT